MSAKIHHTPLVTVAIETERYVASAGWDQPPRLFALVATRDLLAAEPGLAPVDPPPGNTEIDADASDPRAAAVAAPELDHDELSAIEQDGLPATTDLELLLAQIAWPPEVAGVALAVERVVLPPEAEQDLPDDQEEAAAYLANHPDRADVRIVVAVLRDGESACLLRQRAHDTEDKVAIGNDIAPQLVAAVAATLED